MTSKKHIHKMVVFLAGYFERNHCLPKIVFNPILIHLDGSARDAIRFYNRMERDHPLALKELIRVSDELEESGDVGDGEPSRDHPGCNKLQVSPRQNVIAKDFEGAMMFQ